MVLRLNEKDSDFASRFSSFLGQKREAAEDVDARAAEIIADVRRRGDAALIDWTARLDRLSLRVQDLRIAQEDLEAAWKATSQPLQEALSFAHERITTYHQRQKPQDTRFTDALGVTLGWRWTPVEAAGLYVPGGMASYPSSVLMNAIPARIAGVPRLVMAVPTPDGVINPLVLAAAKLCGIDEIYRIGGAQAIAALAYGTESILPVAKIVGPGNAYVAAAKRRVFGTVGIDLIAGPSEILVVADGENDPDWLAADLLAQAEHDVAAQAILLTDDARLAARVEAAVAHQLTTLPRRDIATRAWNEWGAIILVESVIKAAPLIDRIAAEHVELAVTDPEPLAATIKNAGALFLGRTTPEAIGDYVGGSNHVLPTARSARFSSGLGVLDFMKRTSLLSCDEASLAVLAEAAIHLAEAEGLDAHARSIAIRLNQRSGN